jgi:2-dehydropantoate 2-reductase
MNILVYGTGAVGGYFGGKLALNPGNNVAFIARGNYAGLKKEGLKVKSIDGDFKVEVKVYKTPQQSKIKPDLVLICTKSQDTEEVIEKLKPNVTKDTKILSLQNGLTNYDKLSKAFGKKRVIRGFCYIGSEMLDDGTISHTSNGFIVIGESDGIQGSIIDKVEKVFSEAGVRVNVAKDIIHDIWVKFSWNCVYNILCALIEQKSDKLFSNEFTEKLTISVYNEVKALAEAYGVKFTKKDYDNVITRGKTGGVSFKPSTLQDRLRGKSLEYEAFTGDVVRLAARKRVDVPVNKMLYALMKGIDK